MARSHQDPEELITNDIANIYKDCLDARKAGHRMFESGSYDTNQLSTELRKCGDIVEVDNKFKLNYYCGRHISFILYQKRFHTEI